VNRYQQVDAKGFVVPAQAGAQKHAHKKIKHYWIPAPAYNLPGQAFTRGNDRKDVPQRVCIKLLGDG
jgi:hypothetical protein